MPSPKPQASTRFYGPCISSTVSTGIPTIVDRSFFQSVTAISDVISPQISWLPKNAFPGDVIRVEVIAATELEALTLRFIEQPLQFQETQKRGWRAFAGIDLEAKPGSYWIKGYREAGRG